MEGLGEFLDTSFPALESLETASQATLTQENGASRRTTGSEPPVTSKATAVFPIMGDIPVHGEAGVGDDDSDRD